jgi:hypothetical protein
MIHQIIAIMSSLRQTQKNLEKKKMNSKADKKVPKVEEKDNR